MATEFGDGTLCLQNYGLGKKRKKKEKKRRRIFRNGIMRIPYAASVRTWAEERDCRVPETNRPDRLRV